MARSKNGALLYRLIKARRLKQREAAALLLVSPKTIEAWLAPAGAKNHRVMPDLAASYARAVLKEQK